MSSIVPTTAAFSEGPSATDFLMPSTEIPDAFTRVGTPPNVPLFERLRTVDASFGDADVAVRAFWAGNTEKNPEWVLFTSACVVRDELPLESAIEATEESHQVFIDEYEAETSSLWRFERRHERHPEYLNWSADIWIDEKLLDGPANTGERHTFTETIRLQARGSVLVWTGLFGPVEQSFQEWPYARLLDRITEFQQTKLDAVSEEAISGTTGGST
jgi:hypothetical protein